MPALLKGLFDRAWLPGFAYKFLPSGIGWVRLLKGRTARVFVTSDSPPLMARVLFRDNTKGKKSRQRTGQSGLANSTNGVRKSIRLSQDLEHFGCERCTVPVRKESLLDFRKTLSVL